MDAVRDGVDPEVAAELALVRAIQGGDPRGWAALVSRYQDRLYAVCLRMVGDREAAADLTQDTFVKVIQGLGSYDGRSRLSTWLIRVAMNTCLSWKRSQRLRRHTSLDGMGTGGDGEAGGWGGADGWVGEGGGSGGAERGAWAGVGRGGRGGRELGPGEGVEQSEQHARVAAALASLQAEQRAILVLRDVQGLDYEQIALVLDVPVGTVKSRLFRARLALREAIEGKASEGA